MAAVKIGTYSYDGTLIGTHRCSTDWCYFQWPWATLTTPFSTLCIVFHIFGRTSGQSWSNAGRSAVSLWTANGATPAVTTATWTIFNLTSSQVFTCCWHNDAFHWRCACHSNRLVALPQQLQLCQVRSHLFFSHLASRPNAALSRCINVYFANATSLARHRAVQLLESELCNLNTHLALVVETWFDCKVADELLSVDNSFFVTLFKGVKDACVRNAVLCKRVKLRRPMAYNVPDM